MLAAKRAPIGQNAFVSGMPISLVRLGLNGQRRQYHYPQASPLPPNDGQVPIRPKLGKPFFAL
jgi:hypothetical protein